MANNRDSDLQFGREKKHIRAKQKLNKFIWIKSYSIILSLINIIFNNWINERYNRVLLCFVFCVLEMGFSLTLGWFMWPLRYLFRQWMLPSRFINSNLNSEKYSNLKCAYYSNCHLFIASHAKFMQPQFCRDQNAVECAVFGLFLIQRTKDTQAVILA